MGVILYRFWGYIWVCVCVCYDDIQHDYKISSMLGKSLDVIIFLNHHRNIYVARNLMQEVQICFWYIYIHIEQIKSTL